MSCQHDCSEINNFFGEMNCFCSECFQNILLTSNTFKCSNCKKEFTNKNLSSKQILSIITNTSFFMSRVWICYCSMCSELNRKPHLSILYSKTTEALKPKKDLKFSN